MCAIYLFIMCYTLLEIRGDKIFENCQFLDWNGRIIPDEEKRLGIREFVKIYSGFPERCRHTNEFAWPLLPELKSAECVKGWAVKGMSINCITCVFVCLLWWYF